MANQYDIVVVGGGHNSLVAATVLARSGRSVLVLERRELLGGLATTEEFAPGFRCSSCFAGAELFHPAITRELGLQRHGLTIRELGTGTRILDQEHGLLNFCAEDAWTQIGRLSGSDAAAFAEFEALTGRIVAALEPMMTQPLPRLEEAGVGDVVDLLRIGLRLRKLGKRDMSEAMRLLPMSLNDALSERFETPALMAGIAASALTATWLGPFSPGGMLGLLHHRPAWAHKLFTPPATVLGGLGALSGAIASVARESGVEIRTTVEVTTILVNQGRTTGVVTKSGEEIPTHAVVSGLDPQTTLLRLTAPGWLDPEVATAVRDVRTRGTVAVVKLALDELPALGFNGSGEGDHDWAGRLLVGSSLTYLEQAFDGVKYGELPTEPMLEIQVPTLVDPSLAPEGKHVMHVWTQYVPYTLCDGGWEQQRDELGDLVVRTIEQHAPGLSSRILSREVLTPVDIETRFGATGGCVHHAELALDQMFFMRPIPGLHSYAMPVDGLYLCGPATHPGGGVTGLPGRNAARQLLADWHAGNIT